jgi:perosamine synthetase
MLNLSMKPLFIGVLPNFETEEYRLAAKLFWATSSYEESKDEFASKLISVFHPETNTDDILKRPSKGSVTISGRASLFLLDSARSSFHFALQSLNLTEGSEVLLPSFTCVVIVNPVLWNKLTPIYVDMDKSTFNTPVKELLANVTDKTKVILVQHTFGNVIDVDELRAGLVKIKREDVFIIEDLAHSFGGYYPVKVESKQKGVQVGTIVFKPHEPAPVAANSPSQTYRLGTKADMALVTFGVEKVISTIRGGGLFVNHTKLTENLLQTYDESYKQLPELPGGYLRKLLFNPIFWSIVTPLYSLGIGKFTIGKMLVWVARKLGLLGIEIDKEEYGGVKPNYVPAKLPGKLAEIGKVQIGKLAQINSYRREVATKYAKMIAQTSLKDNPEQKQIRMLLKEKQPHTFLRFPLLLPSKNERDKFLAAARKQKIVLGDWYKTMFYTDPKFLRTLKYTKGDCPVTEEIKDRILNLPTSINVTPQHLASLEKLLLQEFPIKN